MIINNLYEHYKNTPKKLKIVCDWDEVIQAHEPYVMWKTLGGEFEKKGIEYPDFPEIFEEFWSKDQEEGKWEIEYSPYDSRMKFIHWKRGNADMPNGELSMWNYADDISGIYANIKNSTNFYQQAPFLTIAEDLAKLIKEDKVEQLIFLSAYDKRKFPNGDERKLDIFYQTFGSIDGNDNKEGEVEKDFRYYSCGDFTYTAKFELIGFDSETQGQTKADWIKENASDFDIVIDDNPNICRSIIENNRTIIKLCEDCSVKDEKLGLVLGNANCDKSLKMNISVFAPYYPAIENQYHSEVLLVKNEVSELKKENFNK